MCTQCSYVQGTARKGFSLESKIPFSFFHVEIFDNFCKMLPFYNDRTCIVTFKHKVKIIIRQKFQQILTKFFKKTYAKFSENLFHDNPTLPGKD